MDHDDMIKVDASVRETCGTGSSRALRAANYIPAVVYGKNRDPLHIYISYVDFIKKCRSYSIFSKLVELHIGDQKKEYVIVKDIQKHPVSGAVLHADFQFVDKDAEIKIEVPLEFINEHKCVGVKRGGVLNVLHRSLLVRCSPNLIPRSLEIDLIDLSIGHSLHVSDLKLPKTMTVAMKEDNPVIVTVSTTGEAAETEADASSDTSEATNK